MRGGMWYNMRIGQGGRNVCISASLPGIVSLFDSLTGFR